jgi:hypothetical protein
MSTEVSKRGVVKLLVALLAQAAIDLFSSSEKERQRSAEFFLSTQFKKYLEYLENTPGCRLTPGKIVGLDRVEIKECAEAVLMGQQTTYEKYRSKVFDAPAVRYLLGIKQSKFPFVPGRDGVVIKLRKTLKDKVQMNLIEVR